MARCRRDDWSYRPPHVAELHWFTIVSNRYRVGRPETNSDIIVLLLAIYCALFFFGYLVTSKRRWIILFLLIGVGYQLLSFRYYFHGGWEASGNAHPFNEEIMFSMIVLGSAASLLGFVARLTDMRWISQGKSGSFRSLGYVLFVLIFAALAAVLTLSIPLSFDRPIDLTLCDRPGDKPDYCDRVVR